MPVLPAELHECLDAPTPFLIGLQSDALGRVDPSVLAQLVVVDLDRCGPCGPTGRIRGD